MNQVLVYTERADFRSYLDSECLNIKDCFPVFYDTIEELQTILDIFPKFDVLVIDAPKDHDEFARLSEFVSKRKDQISHVILVADEDSPSYTKVFASADWPALLTHLKTILVEKSTPEDSFVGVPVDCLIHFKVMPFALFLNLPSGRFVKRIPAYEAMDVEILEGYRKLGVKELFFERIYGKDFAHMLMNNMINRMDQDYGTPAEKEKATSEVFGTVRDIVAAIGLKPRVIELCQTLMTQVMDEVDKGRGVQAISYLQKLRGRPELDFNYRFIQLTSFIATQILDGRSRARKNEDILAVVYAAFFSDMSLKNPEYLHFRCNEDIALLSEDARDEIKWHASLSASMVELSKIGPPEVSTIIGQHHGDLSGTDIPKKVHPGLLDLSKCLFASQELAYALLTNADQEVWKVFQEVFRAHKGGPLKEYLEVYEGAFLNYVKETG